MYIEQCQLTFTLYCIIIHILLVHPTVSCTDLPSISNGVITYSPTTSPRLEGAVATYSCNTDYTVVGVDMRTCVDSGTGRDWNGMEPVCTGNLL